MTTTPCCELCAATHYEPGERYEEYCSDSKCKCHTPQCCECEKPQMNYGENKCGYCGLSGRRPHNQDVRVLLP